MPEHHTDTAATPAPDDTLRERLLEAAVVVWQQRSDERITASPTEHCAAMVDALLPLIRDHVAAAVQAERERVSAALDEIGPAYPDQVRRGLAIAALLLRKTSEATP